MTHSQDSRTSLSTERRQITTAYFLYFATLGLYLPYFPVYLKSTGLSGIQIGWLLAMGPLMRGLLPPVFGLAADRFKGPRFWSALTAWVATAGILCIWFGGMLPLVIGIFIYFVATSATIPLLDAAALQHLHRFPAPYGKLRLWGSIGFIVTSFGLGKLFPAMPPALIIGSLILFHMAFAANISLSRVENGISLAHPERKEVWTLLSSAPMFALLVALFLSRVSSAPFNGFYSLFVQESGLQGDVVAWTWGIAVTVEVLTMFQVDKLIDKFGPMRVMAFGALLEILRWFAYSRFHSASALLMLAPGHGIAFTMMYVAAVRRTRELAPERLRATAQGLAAAATGLGQMAGYVGAGYLHEKAGNTGMFTAAGFCGMITLGAVLVAARFPGKSAAAPKDA